MSNSCPYNTQRFFMVASMVLLLFVGHLQLTESVTCDPVQISWCLQSIVSYLPPTPDCCRRLKGQEACLCKEMSDPTFGGYLRLPGAKMVCDKCHVTYPNC
ncbi:non-specific lipid-transfer protein 2-like [Rutidosis leptorrhynchoides]|uniref:non-specific lipid-transfer protein 2-like n=1 Tax=Rutidosis leptorrhynchoides TaxID=125765 RepID=UPI003A99F18E